MLLQEEHSVSGIILPHSGVEEIPIPLLPATITEIIRSRPQHLNTIDRLISKSLMLLGESRLLGFTGERHIQTGDPFILVANHSQMSEAVLLPIWLAYLRQGRLIHFMADWNFRLIPVVSTILRRGRTIPVALKPARPKFFNRFKQKIVGEVHGFELAKQHLDEGKSIGIFPEGTINPNPKILLRGHLGAAKLSLATGAPLIPLGIRFPHHDPSNPISFRSKMEIEIGAPIHPPQSEKKQVFRDNDINSLHSVMMQHLADLSHKHWNPFTSRRTKL